jgi:nucleotide-binding universal stress UspA family protein
MGYASVMVHVDQCDGATRRIEFACKVADAFGATLIGISGSRPNPAVIGPYTNAAMIAQNMALECEVATRDLEWAKAHFHSIAGSDNRQIAWRGALDAPVDFIARECRAADLIVVGRDSSQSWRRTAVDAGEMMMSAGRPILIVPSAFQQDPIDSPIIVAWKESRESRRAVVDALSFLRAAADVCVVEICEDDEIARACARTADVAAFLARHGVKAKSEALAAADESVAQRLIALARQKSAGLIVMGGYGHARLREWAFGGVTQEMLKTTPIACLLSH